MGFVVVLLRIPDVADFASRQFDINGLDWMLIDAQANPDKQRLLFHSITHAHDAR